MRRGDEDRLFRAAIVWDKPTLRKFPAETNQFISSLVLSPEYYADQVLVPKQDPVFTLDFAALALKDLLTHQSGTAPMDSTWARPDAGESERLFAALWRAWIHQQSPDVLDDSVRFVELCSSDDQLRARAFLKLAVWSKSEGLNPRALELFDRAFRFSRGDLRLVLRRNAGWFGKGFVIGGKQPKSDLVHYPWISNFSGQAATESVIAQIRRRAGGGFVRSFGGSVAGLRDVEAAVLQAEWAGAFWLLPMLYRLKSSILLQDERTERLDEGLALWAVSGGGQTGELVDSFEGKFTSETADSIVVEYLKLGERLIKERQWLDICGSLWDEVSDDIAREIVRKVRLDDVFVNRYPSGEEASATSLFAVLSVRSFEEWEHRLNSMSEELRGVVFRCMTPSVARRLPRRSIRAMVEASLAIQEADQVDEGWKDMGWMTMATAIDKLGDLSLQESFAVAIPDSALSSVSYRYPELLPSGRIENRISSVKEILKRLQEDWSRGSYSVFSSSPSLEAVLLMKALGRTDKSAVRDIVEIASSPRASVDQTVDALGALRLAVNDALDVEPDIRRALVSRGTSHLSFWDNADDKDVEEAARDVLRALVEGDGEDSVVGACKHWSVRVRRVGMEGALDLARRRPSAALDNALFGGLFDPEPAVQELALKGLVDGLLMDSSVEGMGWARLLVMWPDMHRRVRAFVAAQIATRPFARKEAQTILAWASEDRSVSVRLSVVESPH